MRHFVSLSLGLIVAIGLASLAGCGGKSKSSQGVVTGTITYKGQPVNAAGLQLYNEKSELGESINVPVNQDGTYRAADIAPGTYKVVVLVSSGESPLHIPKTMTDPAKLAEAKAKQEAAKTPATIKIPSSYTMPATTKLTMTVQAGEQTIPLELKD
ncbi:MAG TPA: DUF3823 domain-containing protein [Urbifossiella sp.]|jgi:hypothetical protein|nr:DUF3823 domain-containing protein [Urbifossiella sp.]